ncbi:hypothetical protein GCM10027290_61010 [Micromonospora sonneratiae]|uniref:Septum formation family protein n=1 Tax=Micromonospora sonneratiae TaxID=1184706 RepID=A0ABW3YHE5_9ACTN
MRRWPRAATYGVLISILLTGCGTPAGTDGDLVDDWDLPSEAAQFTPQSGVCHSEANRTGYLSSYVPVDCGQQHKAETIHVGVFPAEYAELSSPPVTGSPALRAVFPDCDTRAQQFVGADWRGARLAVLVVPPSPQGWAGGSRWYRCDLFVRDVIEGGSAIKHRNDNAVDHTGSLRGVLSQPSPLSYGCYNEDQWEILRPVPCDKPHRFEYVGIWSAPFSSIAEVGRDAERTHRKCRSAVAAYVKVPDDALLPYRTGTSYRTPTAEAWALGDRGVRCFMWSDKRVLTRSLKGAGPTGLPLR